MLVLFGVIGTLFKGMAKLLHLCEGVIYTFPKKYAYPEIGKMSVNIPYL